MRRDIRDIDLDSEIEDVADLLLEMQAESPFFSEFEPDVDHFVFITDHIENNKGFAKAAVFNGKMVGVMLGIVSTISFIKATCAREIVLYIKPEHRDSFFSIRLIKEFEKFAKSREVDFINMGITSEINDSRIGQLYERLGYEPKGRNYSKRIS